MRSAGLISDRHWLSLLGGAVVLVAFGAVWLSVPRQHPYKGPTAAGLLVMYGVLICWVVVVARVARRASAGISGRSERQQRAYAAIVVVALVAVSGVPGVLKSDGVSLAIVYGIYPATAQLIVLGHSGPRSRRHGRTGPGWRWTRDHADRCRRLRPRDRSGCG